MANAGVAEALRAAARHRTGKALVGQQTIAGELIEHSAEFRGIFIVADMPRELARKLGAAMVAPSQQRDRAA